MKHSSTLLILVILVLGGILRFWFPADIPFTHDELSALSRTGFDSFSELIEKGVRPDGHPAGIQVFLYYWVRLVGRHALLVKLPFIFMGIASIYLIYRLGSLWFNRTVGTVAAVYLATLQYPLMYSQIARPYVSGLFFSLGMVLYWTHWINGKKEGRGKYFTGFILFATLCAYNHHFSMLLAFIVGITGLFLVPRRSLRLYLLAGFIIFLLYLPHLGILLDQLKMKGIGGWLGKPDNDFILHYLAYIFHFSGWVMLAAGFMLVYGLWHHRRMYAGILTGKYYLLSMAFFILPFLTGFIYSLTVDVVLQYSVLIFFLPFVLFIFIGLLPEMKLQHRVIMVLLLAAINIFSLVFERKHYRLFYTNPYETGVTLTKTAGEIRPLVRSLIDMPSSVAVYYGPEQLSETDYENIRDFKNSMTLYEYLEDLQTPYLSVSYAAISPPDLLFTALQHYPHLLWSLDTHGGGCYFLSRTSFEREEKPYYREFRQEFPEGDTCRFVPDKEWGPAFSMSLEEMIRHRNDFIDISINVHAERELKEALLVFSLESEGKNISWYSINLEDFRSGNETFFPAWSSIKLADIRQDYPDILCKIYIWNRGKDAFAISDVKIRSRRGNRVIYGLIEPI